MGAKHSVMLEIGGKDPGPPHTPTQPAKKTRPLNLKGHSEISATCIPCHIIHESSLQESITLFSLIVSLIITCHLPSCVEDLSYWWVKILSIIQELPKCPYLSEGVLMLGAIACLKDLSCPSVCWAPFALTLNMAFTGTQPLSILSHKCHQDLGSFRKEALYCLSMYFLQTTCSRSMYACLYTHISAYVYAYVMYNNTLLYCVIESM